MPIGNIERLPYSITATSAGALTMASLSSGGAITLTVYNPKTDETIEVGGNVMETITAFKGDFGYDLMFSVAAADGGAFDLTDASSVVLKVGRADGSAVKFSGSCIVVSPSDGEFVYTTGATDFSVVGDFDMQIVITFSSPAKQYTIGGMTLSVLGSLPKVGVGVLP